MLTTLIVTPIEKEFTALAEYLASEGHVMEWRGGTLASAWFRDLAVVLAVGGHGKARFAAATQYLIDTCGPIGVVITAGVSGALDRSLRPGDVVIGTETVEHDFKERFQGYAPPPRHPCSPGVRAEIEVANPKSSPVRVYAGAIASGDEDVVDAERAAELYKLTGALCVAWEGAGGARAAQLNSLPFLEIRAVTDAADEEAPESFRAHLADAVTNIGRVLLPWLRARLLKRARASRRARPPGR